MVKSKKMSKSAVAIIVLALLLVLSMVMGLTGAWFTQSGKSSPEGSSGSITFGHITEDVDYDGEGSMDLISRSGVVASTQDVKAVPGDSLTFSPIKIAFSSNIDTYLFVKTNLVIEASLGDEGAFRPLSSAEIEELFGSENAGLLQAMVTLTEKTSPEPYEHYSATGTEGGYTYYLYQNADSSVKRDGEYKVEWNGSAVGAMQILTSVTNHAGDALSPTDWSDVTVRVSYQVEAGVCQAHNVESVAEALAATGLVA